jgi:cysteinyl-tRNA synthetase
MTNLYLHDTMAREKRLFRPKDPGRVTMYVCGPTVYNYAHIGNARPVVVFDVLFRLLRRLYGEAAVIYARNITDVDDKINAKAAEEGVPISVITDRFTAVYHQDMDALGALRPTLEPRATAHIAEMLALIGRLVENGQAYAAEGHVLFDVAAFPDYGQLSNRSLDDMIAGARVEVAPYKKNAADFVLWKPSKPGEPVWDSPWGPGRPGWHLECSAMIEKNLGLPIDIHGGGHDLIFPHHENELAQSRCADHAPALAEYWVHNGFLDMAGEKMSKSLGNVLLVHELVERVPGEALRWALLSAHYRQPLDWTGELVEQSRKNLDGLYGAMQRANHALADASASQLAHGSPSSILVQERVSGIVENALCEDLNTPKAFALLADSLRQLNLAVDARKLEEVAFHRAVVSEMCGLLGFLQSDPDAWFQGGANEELTGRVETLIAARAEARKAKDWPAADRIRAELTELGVEVMDGPQGATWRLKGSEGGS